MKILLVADEESKYLWDYYQPGKLAGYDFILSCGDLKQEYLEFLVTMGGKPLYYIHGNHDKGYEKFPPEGCDCIEDQVVNEKKAYDRTSSVYPRQCAAMEHSIHALSILETERIEDPDTAAETFAMMMAEVFVYQEDRWSDTLRAFGSSLGRFLYVMDACMDLDQDAFRNHYNPFRRYYGLNTNREYFSEILQMLLGDCLLSFDRLPLVTDIGILKNILCFGLWTKFDKKFNIVKDENHGIGSV